MTRRNSSGTFATRARASSLPIGVERARHARVQFADRGQKGVAVAFSLPIGAENYRPRVITYFLTIGLSSLPIGVLSVCR